MKVITGSDSFIANAAKIVAQSLTSPLETTIIRFPREESPLSALPGDPVSFPPNLLNPFDDTDVFHWTAPNKEAPRFRGSFIRDVASKFHRPEIVTTPIFKIALNAVIALTMACPVAEILMATFWADPTAMQQATYNTMDFGWKAGFGALVGLVGGKNAR